MAITDEVLDEIIGTAKHKKLQKWENNQDRVLKNLSLECLI